MRSFLTLFVFGLLAIHVINAMIDPPYEEELDREMALVEKALGLVEEEKLMPVFVDVPLSIVGKPTEQSSTYSQDLTSDKAVDGSSSSNLNTERSCTHTALGAADPWWRVDLGEEFCITKVTILNRGDCCSSRLENAVVRVGLSSTPTDNEICGSPVTASQAETLGGIIHFRCRRPSVKARYISVDIPGSATLQLCEVIVDRRIPSYCY